MMPKGRGSGRRRARQRKAEHGARREDVNVWGVKDLPSHEDMAAMAAEQGLRVEEVEAVVSMPYLDGAEAAPGKTCPGPVVVHEDGVVECVTCWKLASARHGSGALVPCDKVEGGRCGWRCPRCSGSSDL